MLYVTFPAEEGSVQMISSFRLYSENEKRTLVLHGGLISQHPSLEISICIWFKMILVYSWSVIVLVRANNCFTVSVIHMTKKLKLCTAMIVFASYPLCLWHDYWSSLTDDKRKWISEQYHERKKQDTPPRNKSTDHSISAEGSVQHIQVFCWWGGKA